MTGAPATGGSDRAVAQLDAFPLRPSKYELPTLPDETLRRDRLLDWLNVKIHRRAIFVVAEAGYGKTTLLADFARRTRIRAIWYRLDEDETDPLVFLRYLVAACRHADANLLPRTAELLVPSPSGPPSWEVVLQALLGEIAPLGFEPTVVFFDDYQFAEALPGVREIAERLLAKAPERVTFVFASRRQPRLSVARLRVREELAELTRDELRFDEAEAEKLFRETYHRPLDSDTVHDMMDRTEGWPASLQLVREAVKRRTAVEASAFIRSLSGADGDLYDYLAEEVVSDLDADLRGFLERIALLEEINAETASATADIDVEEARRLISVAEADGLISRPMTSGGELRFHPLVRDFLRARLFADLGADGVREIHRRIAAIEEPRSWKLAAHHWREAGERADVRRVIESNAETVIGAGDCEVADAFITWLADLEANACFDVIRSRLLWSKGMHEDAVLLAKNASAITASGPVPADLARLVARNEIYFASETTYDVSVEQAALSRYRQVTSGEEETLITKAHQAVLDCASGGSLEDAYRACQLVLAEANAQGRSRDAAIAHINLSFFEIERGQHEAAHRNGLAAIDDLGDHGSPDEIASAQAGAAIACAHRGFWDEATARVNSARAIYSGLENALDIAEMHVLYGDPADALTSLSFAWSGPERERLETVANVVRGMAGCFPDFTTADAFFESIAGESVLWPVWYSRIAFARAYVAAVFNVPEAMPLADEAIRRARKQEAWSVWDSSVLLRAAVDTPDRLGSAVKAIAERDVSYLTIVAGLLVRRLAELDNRSLAAVWEAAGRHPAKWKVACRHLLSNDLKNRSRLQAARLLEEVGDAADIPLLKAIEGRATRSGKGAFGRRLIRRLAPKAYVQDLGPIAVHVGGRVVQGTHVRRKALALLCFLLTRHRYSATTEQVVDALWPGLDPTTALNSLNQTLYFLRRVFEPDFAEETSAGYVRHDGELIVLDDELVSAQSSQCVELMARLRYETKDEPLRDLAARYSAPFALDFAYEDWASFYREHIQATFLSLVERLVAHDNAVGRFDRTIPLVRRALEIDPSADHVELLLLRLYKQAGAHAAAAEQYGHYAAAIRGDLGTEPVPFNEL